MSNWIQCPNCGTVMTVTTSRYLCPMCGTALPVKILHMTSGTSPTVDAVPVIRCRECRHRLAILMNGQPVVMLCGNERNGEAFPVDIDDYCSRAERKEE